MINRFQTGKEVFPKDENDKFIYADIDYFKYLHLRLSRQIVLINEVSNLTLDWIMS